MKIYNKLVRDKIPEIIEADGKLCATHILSEEEYIAALEAKLNEEVAFSKESSKYVGCGILKRNFYTRFIPIFKDFGL